MENSELSEYEKAFNDLMGSIKNFSESGEYHKLNEEERKVPDFVLESFGNFFVDKIKNQCTPEEMLEYIAIIDKLYFQFLMKNEICSRIFESIYEQDKDIFSKFTGQLPDKLKEELKGWMDKHGKRIFE